MLAASLGLGALACKSDRESRPADDGGAKMCKAEDCGPAPGVPNVMCPDGVTMSGPGECVLSGSDCAWEIVECPKDVQTLSCGGLAGQQCPVGQICVDDPSDSCDPNAGGADCMGTCQVQH